MKMGIALFVILLIGIFIGTYNYLSKYRSAFEADQSCHYDQISRYVNLDKTGCDHDLETRQWILFQKGISNQPAQVIKRYRY